MKKVIIVGAGGQGKVIADIVRVSGDKVLGFLDDKNTSLFTNINILGTTANIGAQFDTSIIGDTGDAADIYYFAAIGDNRVRERLMRHKVKWYTAVHPRASIANGAKIEEGSCIMANAVINPDAHIGRGVIVNTAATVDHDCRIGDFTHISVGANLAGTVFVGARCQVGIGSAVMNNITIKDNSIIGAGAVVTRDITESGIYVGIPAKKLFR